MRGEEVSPERGARDHCNASDGLAAGSTSAGMRACGRTVASLALATLAGLLLLQDASAHSGAKGIVKERMDAMSELGDASKAISDMVKRKRPLDAVEVGELTKTMQRHAARIPELFPDTHDSREGSATAALPAIWSRWARFEALASKLGKESGVLESVAAGGDARAIRKQFGAVAKTCRGCHTDFRRPED